MRDISVDSSEGLNHTDRTLNWEEVDHVAKETHVMEISAHKDNAIMQGEHQSRWPGYEALCQRPGWEGSFSRHRGHPASRGGRPVCRGDDATHRQRGIHRRRP